MSKLLPTRRELLRDVGLAAVAVPFFEQARAQTPQHKVTVLPIEFSSEKMVFCDWWFVEAGYGLAFTPAQQEANHLRPMFMPYGVRLRPGKPIFSEKPIVLPDVPTDGITMGAYCTLLKDGGKYRLWYESYQPLAKGDADAKICYAESDDGFSWTKPDAGIFEYQGSKKNNLVYSNGHGATIFIDPTAKPDERYKMIHLDRAPLQTVNGKQINAFLFAAVSPDGIQWKRLPEPLIKHTSDTQSVAAYDPVLKKYVAYLRGWEPQTRAGYGGRRILMRTESPEFGNFPEPVTVMALGPADPPDADIYTSAYHQWPGAAKAHLMIPAIYHHASDTVDLRLAVSRDGLRWDLIRQEPLISVGEPGSGYEGTIYAGCGIVPVGKGTWAFPVARNYRTHNMKFEPTPQRPRQGSLWLAMLREDGFMALEAENEGECWTQPATFSGSRMLINSWGLTGARVSAELTDESGKPFPGYSLAECDGLFGEQLWTPMVWKGKADVSALQGKLIRIHFALTRARVHGFRFAS
jgi:hypothetical protein